MSTESPPLRCLVLADDFPSAIEPWRSVPNRRQIECLATRCAVTVIDPLPWKRLASERRAWSIISRPDPVLPGVPLYHPPFWYLPVIGRGGTWRGVYAATRRTLQRWLGGARFDVILATFAYPQGMAARQLAADLGIPYVIKARGSDLHQLPPSGAVRARTAEAVCGAAALIAVSRNLADIAGQLGARAENLHLLPNGIDAGSFPLLARADARRTLGIAAEGKVLLFVGRLHAVKRLDILVEAIRLIVASSPNAFDLLAIGGDGPVRGALEKRIASAGLQGRIRLTGQLEREQVALWMNAADLFLLPSQNEGCPNVVLEALTCGTPVVASRVGALPDLVDESAGLLVPPGDAPALARAIRSALDRPWDRAALRNRMLGSSWESNAQALEGILRRVVERARTTPREVAP